MLLDPVHSKDKDSIDNSRGAMETSEKILWERRRTTIERLYGEQAHRLAELREKLGDAERGLELLSIAKSAFKGLSRDWSIESPGKYHPAYFFRGPEGRVIAEELVEGNDVSSSTYPVIPLSRIYRAQCPKCHTTGLPLVEELHGDESQWFVPCTTCGAQEVKRL